MGAIFGIFDKNSPQIIKKEVLLMKQAIQRLTLECNLENRVRFLGLMAICLGAIILSGCQQTTASSTPEAAQHSPFNTSENGAWGDESSFLRMADLTGKTDELRVDDFSNGELKLSDEREYVAVVYLHNTSDHTQQGITITLRHADVLRAGTENQLEALIGWDGEDTSFISDSLRLDPTVDLSLYPADNDSTTNVAIIRQSDGELSKTPLTSVSLDGTTTHMITLGEIPSGDSCIVFFVFEALPVTR